MARKWTTKRGVEEVEGIKNLTHNPSPGSRLGDVGYVDEAGNWRRVLNILDKSSCEPLGISCLRLARGLPQYITQRKYVPFDQPVIQLYSGGGFQVLTGEDLARYTFRDALLNFRLMGSEELAKKARQFSLGVLISPHPQQTMTAFMVGPKIFVRSLQLPVLVLQAWLGAYSPHIGKFARKLFHLFPPSNGRSQLCLCLKDFFTETWRTIYVKPQDESSPIAIGWNPSSLNDRSGTWTLLEMPETTSFISGGLSSYNVMSPHGETNFRMGRNGQLGVMG